MKGLSRRFRAAAAFLLIICLVAPAAFAGVDGRPRPPKSSNPFLQFIEKLFRPRPLDDLVIPKP